MHGWVCISFFDQCSRRGWEAFVLNPSHVRAMLEFVFHRMYARVRPVVSCRCVRACDSCKVVRRVLSSSDSKPVYSIPYV